VRGRAARGVRGLLRLWWVVSGDGEEREGEEREGEAQGRRDARDARWKDRRARASWLKSQKKELTIPPLAQPDVEPADQQHGAGGEVELGEGEVAHGGVGDAQLALGGLVCLCGYNN
jgi:hypothetical protein